MQMFWADADQPLAINNVHPCVINCVPSLVHHPDLEREDLGLFQFLQALASRSGFQLLRDRRHCSEATAKNRRRWKHRKKWIPLFLLSAGMMLPKLSYASEVPLASIKAFMTNLSSDIQNPKDLGVVRNPLMSEPFTESRQDWQKKIAEILTDHWQPGEKDPENMMEQISALANYYSQFPEVRRLLVALSDLPWHMQYSSNRYLTEVFGTQKAVHSARIYFDPASAAQLQFSASCIENSPACVASPADVLLHELLHVHQVFADPVRFIAQTTAAKGSYPHAHEEKTIELEQQLYRSMSVVDNLQRPSRTAHVGRSVAARCFTCID